MVGEVAITDDAQFSFLAQYPAGVLKHLPGYAVTDAVLLVTILAAQGAFARLYRAAREGAAPPARMADLFWIAIGLGILVKGPIILLVAGGTMVVLRLIDREARWAADLRFDVQGGPDAVSSLRYTSAYVKRDGEWRMLTLQMQQRAG